MNDNMLNGTENLRKLYMDGKITHHDYYMKIAGLIGVSKRQLPVDEKTIKASTDKHLNDIPLAIWDSRHQIIKSMANRAGLNTWSLSETVCVLKAVAQTIKERNI